MAKTVNRAMLYTEVSDFDPCEREIVTLDHHSQVGRCEHKKCINALKTVLLGEYGLSKKLL